MDNCTRENKNRYTLGYLESLVSWGVFVEVHASFLPLGHTHSDIDQLFSRTATRLHTHSAVTLSDLHDELRHSYTPTPTVNHVRTLANFSGLCETQNYLWETKERQFSGFRYFKFGRTLRSMHERQSGRMYDTYCELKVNSMDDWQPFRPGWSGTGFGGFIVQTPDLNKTPSMVLKGPPNKEEVLKRLVSEETRINSVTAMKALRDLVDDVYTPKTEKFHWDTKADIEAKRTSSSEVGILGAGAETAGSRQLEYAPNEFVAIRHETEGDNTKFWIGKISRVTKSAAGETTKIKVQWFNKGLGQDEFDATYKPSVFRKGKDKTRIWTQDVDVDSVIVKFEALTNKNKLSEETRNRLRQALGSAA